MFLGNKSLILIINNIIYTIKNLLNLFNDQMIIFITYSIYFNDNLSDYLVKLSKKYILFYLFCKIIILILPVLAFTVKLVL